MSKSLFNKIISYFKEREIEFSADEIDVSWRQLIRRIENKRLRLKRLRIVSIVAASVMILLGFFYFVHDGQNSAKTMLVEAQIARMDYPEAKKALMGFCGVGEKVADCICLFGLHRLEAVGDTVRNL